MRDDIYTNQGSPGAVDDVPMDCSVCRRLRKSSVGQMQREKCGEEYRGSKE
jgi:hypothetical protein